MASKGKKKNKGSSLARPRGARDPEPHSELIEITAHSIQGFRGPIPPPEILAGYDNVQPGLADRIVRMAEEQSTHRQHMEKSLLDAQVGDAKADRTERRIGQFLAFGIAVTVTLAGAYGMTQGAEWPGALLGGTGVTGLVVAFLNQRRGKESTDCPAEIKEK